MEDLNAAFLVLLNTTAEQYYIYIYKSLLRAVKQCKVSTYLLFISIFTCSSFSCVPPLLLRNATLHPREFGRPEPRLLHSHSMGAFPYDSLIGRGA